MDASSSASCLAMSSTSALPAEGPLAFSSLVLGAATAGADGCAAEVAVVAGEGGDGSGAVAAASVVGFLAPGGDALPSSLPASNMTFSSSCSWSASSAAIFSAAAAAAAEAAAAASLEALAAAAAAAAVFSLAAAAASLEAEAAAAAAAAVFSAAAVPAAEAAEATACAVVFQCCTRSSVSISPAWLTASRAALRPASSAFPHHEDIDDSCVWAT
mmetsp:Transcript_98546/g.181167  ORF Transcript_98546/g.181167 Transcript_98546/m.181167 type:complete len:215 (-) Transcript_98546:612-1256(-)